MAAVSLSRLAGLIRERIFAQYLTTTQVPVLEYRVAGGTLSYRWTNVVPGFDMPVRVRLSPAAYSLIAPTTAWQTTPHQLGGSPTLQVDPDFYVTARRVD